ncbi:MAG TPA: hypothetical protein VNH19_02710 [Candidatus Limnocylindrales bacterium]|nr:hypothetical protein [Candidatus Limnocylindrales bacterium]
MTDKKKIVFRVGIAGRMVVELLIQIADRGGYERSYARATHGGDDIGGGVVDGELGDAAIGDGADGEPVGARGVYTDQGERGSGDESVHPVAPGTVFGDCEVLPSRWERVFGWDTEGCGELADAEGSDAGEWSEPGHGAEGGKSKREWIPSAYGTSKSQQE